jgi:hypothetical protein
VPLPLPLPFSGGKNPEHPVMQAKLAINAMPPNSLSNLSRELI